MEEDLENKSNDTSVPGKTTVMSKEKVYELCIKPVEEARPIFEYLHRWRCESSRSDFTFYKLSNAT